MPKAQKNIDEHLLHQSLEKGDYKKAKKIIDDFLDQEPSPEEKGKVYTDAVSFYMKNVNQVNKIYLDQLKATTEALKAIDAGERETNDNLRLLSIKKKLIKYEEDDLDN